MSSSPVVLRGLHSLNIMRLQSYQFQGQIIFHGSAIIGPFGGFSIGYFFARKLQFKNNKLPNIKLLLHILYIQNAWMHCTIPVVYSFTNV